MAIEVLIRRKVMESKAKELSPLIVKLRSPATIQPGYISGETLNCIDPPGRKEYLVISTWHSVEDWKRLSECELVEPYRRKSTND